MAAEPYPYMCPEQYLDMDRESGVKHEYVDGVAYAMAGGTRAHNQLAALMIARLASVLRGTEYRVYSSDMRVQVDARYFYPDVTVGCDSRDLGPGDILRFPRVLVEVLSKSTEAYDRGHKFEMYRASESLREYVLVSQTRPSIEVYRRTGDEWIVHSYEGSDTVELGSIGLRFSVQEVYEGVDLEP
jgi:Uma2 family endonuclease